MTVETEIMKVTQPLISNRGMLWLPNWILKDKMCTEIPDEDDLVTESSVQLYPLGTKLVSPDGVYRYCKAGAAMSAVGFLKGNYTQCPGKAGNSVGAGFEGAAYAAVDAGGTTIPIADTAATKNLYEGGLLAIYDDTNSVNQHYRIIGNDASNATYTNLYIAPPGLKVALTTGYGITAYLSPYINIRAVSGGYMSALGYAKFSITSSYFFWLFTAGQISGITGASTWPGQTQYYRDVYCNTDGSLIGYTAGYQRVGFLLGRTASDYGDNHIMLQLDC